MAGAERRSGKIAVASSALAAALLSGVLVTSPASVGAARVELSGASSVKRETCAPLDIALVVDSSSSMRPAIDNVKAEAQRLVDRVADESGGDYRIAIVDFADDVQVRLPFSAANAEAAKAVIPDLAQDRSNENQPEAWDEALVTVIDGRTAAQTANPAASGFQVGDFAADWRPEAKKMVVLVSDARPGGFEGNYSQTTFDRAYAAAVRASGKGIRVATVFVPNYNAEAAATEALDAVANLTGAPRLRSEPDGSNLTAGLDLLVSTCAADRDGDGLFDTWETDGYDVDDDDVIDVDLKAMGADPDHKDLFIQVNWMSPDGARPCVLFVWCGGGPDGPHPPDTGALERVIKAFADAPLDNPDGKTGINVHVDAGGELAGGLEPDGAVIGGDEFEGGPFPLHLDLLDPSASDGKEEFAAVREQLVPEERRALFTWILYAHEIGGAWGKAPGVPGDSIALAQTEFAGDTNKEAVTVMHELGHTLGLRHGGLDDTNAQPNYLSIMNYSFAWKGGLLRGGATNVLDYSRSEMSPLDVNALDESAGVTPLAGEPAPADERTYYFCPNAALKSENLEVSDLAPIDWNCDGDTGDTGVRSNPMSSSTGELTSRDDWATITFAGGERGGLRNEGEPVDDSDLNEEQWQRAGHAHGVSIDSPGAVSTPPGVSGVAIPFVITNTGTKDSEWTLEPSAVGEWETEATTDATLSLASGDSATVVVSLDTPRSAADDAQVTVSLRLLSDDPADMGGSGTATVTIDDDADADLDATGRLEVSPDELVVGEEFTLTGDGFDAGATVVLTSPDGLIPTDTALVDDDGAVTFTATGPDEPDEGRIVVIGGTTPTDPRVLDADVEFVEADTPVARRERSRADEDDDGPSPTLVVAVAAAFVVVMWIAVFVAVRRRRRRRPPTV